jgi:hypothetical protein
VTPDVLRKIADETNARKDKGPDVVPLHPKVTAVGYAVAWLSNIRLTMVPVAQSGKYYMRSYRKVHPSNHDILKTASKVIESLLKEEGYVVTVTEDKHWGSDGLDTWVAAVGRSIVVSWE